ncbi:hypothetical protein AZE42_12829 [Rhizopogon vesiculosus]|uniref:Uncharacterized protein n=1 Tax=Rhizopogon vesiculosus TaxID=180088 RepID=A0A1J8QJU1_9AGAM|nr:hypothetical protein AZE42_12829 [Rhizopogon vesiculosus]
MQLQQGTHYDWVLTNLPCQELKYLTGIKHLNGLIFEAQPDENDQVPADHAMVHINEVLLMWHTIYTLPNSDLQPCYMDFQTFSEIIFMSQEKLQQAMKGFAAIWGGLDMTKNPFEAPVHFHPADCPQQAGESPVHFYSSDCPQQAGELHCTLQAFMLALRRLEKILPIWPVTAESWAASPDHNIITILDTIAQEVTQSSCPTTHLLAKKPQDHCTTHRVLKHEARQSKKDMKIPWDGEMPQNLEAPVDSC